VYVGKRIAIARQIVRECCRHHMPSPHRHLRTGGRVETPRFDQIGLDPSVVRALASSAPSRR
jgi:hypothetical protein